MYVCMYVYVCMHAYIYAHTHTHIHIHTHIPVLPSIQSFVTTGQTEMPKVFMLSLSYLRRK